MAFAAVVAGAMSGGCATPHYAGPVFDVHVHLDPPDNPDSAGTGRVANSSAVLAEIQKLPPRSRAGLVTIAPRGDLARTRTQNDSVLAAAKAHPDLFWPIASVNPWDGDEALSEIDRLAAADVRMLKLHPNTQKFDIGGPEVARVVERAAAHGMAILFDAYSPFDANETGKFLLLAVKQPKAKLILAHLGGPKFVEMLLFAAVNRFSWYPHNVWFDLSMVAHLLARSPFREQLVFVLRSLGLNRVMFGSDFPVVTPAEALSDIRALGLTAEEEKQVLHDTVSGLLNLPDT